MKAAVPAYFSCDAKAAAEMLRSMGGDPGEESCDATCHGSLILLADGSPHSAHFGSGPNPLVAVVDPSPPDDWRVHRHAGRLYVLCPEHGELAEVMERLLAEQIAREREIMGLDPLPDSPEPSG